MFVSERLNEILKLIEKKGKVEVNTKVTKSLDDAVKVWEFVKDSE